MNQYDFCLSLVGWPARWHCYAEIVNNPDSRLWKDNQILELEIGISVQDMYVVTNFDFREILLTYWRDDE